MCFADLVSATNTTNVNIPQMADTLFERSTNASWVVVFKALVTTHHMCVHGNEVSECDADQLITVSFFSVNKDTVSGFGELLKRVGH